MNELLEICSRLNGYDKTNRYDVLTAMRDAETGVWSLTVKFRENKEVKDESNE